MEIRNVTAADAGRLSEMFSRLSERDITSTRDDPRDWVPIDRLGSDADFRWVAVDDDRVVGWAILNRLSGWSDHVGELRLVVDPGARRTGVGRALAQEAVRAGFADGLRKLIIELSDDQDPVVEMFIDLGFTGEARLRQHIRDGDGTLHDLIVLARHTQS
ncbi:MAG: GNAT family N-acetyltransferase [Gordonia sp. (in: high G+C Gram-positive bacteria)]|uniref:GNAT family N-acetyltransferase n=1 Tax=Gordonia TaxID=2053 RepID=UPI0032675420